VAPSKSGQRAAPVGEQGVGFEGRTRGFVELAFEPLDLERPAEALGDGLRQRDVEPAVGLAALMQRKRRQVLVEADPQWIFIRARGRRRHEESGSDREAAHHGFLRLDTKAQISAIS
jgi:hypothetical protein